LNVMKHLLLKAIFLAQSAHQGQKDKCGVPFIQHPMEVARRVVSFEEVVQAAAVLHDVLEDTDWTSSDLVSRGMPDRVVELVEILTHTGDESYFDYIRRVKRDPEAVAIKRADIAHNSEIRNGRAPEPSMIERYRKAIEILDS
jgi:(p)ppGpp synthase/HD superfamily hydrolase